VRILQGVWGGREGGSDRRRAGGGGEERGVWGVGLVGQVEERKAGEKESKSKRESKRHCLCDRDGDWAGADDVGMRLAGMQTSRNILPTALYMTVSSGNFCNSPSISSALFLSCSGPNASGCSSTAPWQLDTGRNLQY
jgi:hypothetical protein